MPNLYSETQGVNTYLVYQINDADELDTMSLGMLTNNSIPGFAAASFTQMDTTKYIKYNVSAKVTVKQLFSGPVNRKRLLGVFSGVVDAMLSAEEYMLDPGSILLDMDYIFADVSTCETELICLPVMNLQREYPDLAMFFKNILFTTQFDQTENCDHVAQLINYLNTNPVLVLADFKALLGTLSNGAAAQPKVERAPAPKPAPQPAPQPAQKPVSQPEVQPAAQPASQPVVQKSVLQQPPMAPQKPVKKEKENPAIPTKSSLPAAPQVTEEKPMSWFYLMQHYNKENAAIYKAQQEAKKAKGGAPASAPKPAKPAPKPAAPVNAGFAVPGKQASANPGFAVPGQPTPPPAPQQSEPQQKIAATPAPQQVAPVYQQPSQPASQPAVSSRPLNFGETTVLSGAIGETTVLSASVEPTKADPHLIRSKNNEKIPLNKPVFRIGKERSYVDYFISDNTAISRGHANIVDHNGEFFVVDTNSTNHTYVNGAMIQPGVETKLSHGDKVRLANEDFEFRLC